MDEMIRKEFASEIKDIDLAAQELTMVVSTEAVDREGDIIEAAGWELGAYRKNPVVLFGHDYRAPAVGKATWIDVMDKALVGRVQFAPTPFAQELWTLYSQGYMRASSVGFIPKDKERIEPDADAADEAKGWYGPTRFKRQELLEFSLVPVPANPEALVAARAAGIECGMVEKAISGQRSAPQEQAPQGQGGCATNEIRTRRADSSAGGAQGQAGQAELPFSDLPVERAPVAREVSQGELGDEMAYLVEIVGRVGISEGMAPLARGLAGVLMRETGGDTASESINHKSQMANIKSQDGDLSRIVMEMVRDEIVRWSKQSGQA